MEKLDFETKIEGKLIIFVIFVLFHEFNSKRGDGDPVPSSINIITNHGKKVDDKISKISKKRFQFSHYFLKFSGFS